MNVGNDGPFQSQSARLATTKNQFLLQRYNQYEKKNGD